MGGEFLGILNVNLVFIFSFHLESCSVKGVSCSKWKKTFFQSRNALIWMIVLCLGDFLKFRVMGEEIFGGLVEVS